MLGPSIQSGVLLSSKSLAIDDTKHSWLFDGNGCCEKEDGRHIFSTYSSDGMDSCKKTSAKSRLNEIGSYCECRAMAATLYIFPCGPIFTSVLSASELQ